MNDANYWKDPKNESAYGEKDWRNADAKVNLVMEIIRQATGKVCGKVGFGATSTEFIDGTAASHGYKKGGADLQVEETNIFIEVTGPNVNWVSKDAALWVRPDKLQTACDDSENITWIVHVLPTKDLPVIRVIQCSKELCERFRSGGFKIDEPRIKGRIERYVSFPANDKCVQDFSVLIDEIKKFGTPTQNK